VYNLGIRASIDHQHDYNVVLTYRKIVALPILDWIRSVASPAQFKHPGMHQPALTK
jgi:hypothetical protein